MKELTPAEKVDLVMQPYLRPCEIRALLGKPRTTTDTAIKAAKLKKYPPLGYLTDDVIAAFSLSGAIKRWKAAA